MTIGISGSGAMGLLFASRLAAAGMDIVCHDTNAEAAEAIARGITIRIGERVETFRSPSSTDPGILADRELVLVCVKAYHAQASAESLARALSATTAVLCVMNGLDPEEPFTRMLGAERVCLCVSYAGAAKPSHSEVLVAGAGHSFVGYSPRFDAAAFAACLGSAGLPAQATRSIKREQWIKAAVNAAINPLAAIEGCRNGLLPGERALMEAARSILAEASAVAAHEGIELDPEALLARVIDTCMATADNECSMLRDLREGRRTEIDWLNGAIARRAALYGIEAPANAAIAVRIASLERGS